MSNKEKVTVSASNLAKPTSPSKWILTVEDWSPTVLNETGLKSPLTTKTKLKPVTLTKLVSWNNITGLESASGIGTYETSFKLNIKSKSTGVLLSLGDVEGSYSIKINGKTVEGVDWFESRPIDVTDMVKDGNNSEQISEVLPALIC